MDKKTGRKQKGVDIVSGIMYHQRMKRKTRTGRPPIPKAQRKSVKVSLRMQSALHRAVKKAAKREGKSVGSYINDVLGDAIEREV